MKFKYKNKGYAKIWFNIGIKACPLQFLYAIFSRIALATVYYFIMINTERLINSFGQNDLRYAKILIFNLLMLAMFSLVFLITQDINDARLNIILKKVYTEEISKRISQTETINLLDVEYQENLNYARQAMGGTQLFSPTLSIINIIFGSIANVLIIINMVKFYYQSVLAFIALTVVFIIGLIIGKKKHKIFFDREERLNPLNRQKNNLCRILTSNQYFQENYIYRFSKRIFKKLDEKNSEINEINYKESKKNQLTAFIYDLSIIITLAGILIALVLTQSEISAGSIIILIGAILSLLQGIKNISYNVSDFTIGISMLKKVEKLKRRELLNEEHSDKRLNYGKSKYIEIENLSFTYPNTKNAIIKNINYRIEKGKTTAIVGDNGSGKTTLMNLIAGIYKPTQGKVFVDGKNVHDIFNDNNAPAIMSIVFQKPSRLVGATVEENIKLSNNVDVIEDLIEKDTFLEELKIQFDKIVGNSFEGVDFSGGQWQKIALLRAVSKSKDILIFDEPTSNLDPIAEKNILEWLINKTQEKTLIIISHRLGGIKHADDIIVMSNGKIIEHGTHEELIDNKSKYYDMYISQAKWYMEE